PPPRRGWSVSTDVDRRHRLTLGAGHRARCGSRRVALENRRILSTCRIAHQRRPRELVRLDRPLPRTDVAGTGRRHLRALRIPRDKDLRIRATLHRLSDELGAVLDSNAHALGVARLVL